MARELEENARVKRSKGHKDPFEEAMKAEAGEESSPKKGKREEDVPLVEEEVMESDADDGIDRVEIAGKKKSTQKGSGDGDEGGDGDDDGDGPGDDDDDDDDDGDGEGDEDEKKHPPGENDFPGGENGGEQEWNDETELQDLMHEEGVHEEGIDADEVPEDPASDEVPATDEEERMEGLPRKRVALDAKHLSNPARDQMKEQLLLKARAHEMPNTSPSVKLELLELPEKKIAFIGRKKGILQKSGVEGGLYIGRVQDDDKYGNYSLYMDSLNPHVVFICGSRGSGKSYLLGVIAEELALHNQDVGVVVVDPVGVFWSMKFPNKEEREVKTLSEFNLMPQGLENLRVFIPEGSKSETPKNTYDGLFSIPPAMLTSEDWALTFGMERFSPTGLLLEKALKKVENGYKTIEGEKREGKKARYGLDDLVHCLEHDAEINSKERGYKPDSIRALVSRFEAAKGWGIFSERGTPLSEISREGQLTVIDTSFLDDTVTALVIGILARRLLAARKVQTRKEAAQKFKTEDADDLLETEIPPTWLFIDEAHTLIPSGNVKTPATTAIVEYVKQGRRPGCSLVFATQQPSAIDTRVLSQLDVIVAHKLIFDDDIKAIMKRTPTIIPMKYKHPNFLKTLPVGIGLTGDRREESSRAFVLRVRPRMSQHEGRDAETGEHKHHASADQVLKLATEMIFVKLEKEGKLEKEEVDQLVQTINAKYKSSVPLSEVLDALENRGARIDPKTMQLISPTFIEVNPTKSAPAEAKTPAQKAQELQQLVQDVPAEEQETSLQALPITLNNQQIVSRLEQAARKSLFGLGGTKEKLQEVTLHYKPIYKVEYRQFTGKTSFIQRTCFIDAERGEFVHYLNNRLVLSKGLQEMASLSKKETHVLHTLARKSFHPHALAAHAGMSEKEIKPILSRLFERQLIQVTGAKDNPIISLSKQVDLPFSGNEHALESLAPLKLVHVRKIKPISAKFSSDDVHGLLASLWPEIVVTNVSEIYQPLIEATLTNPKTHEFRTIFLDGFTGNLME